MTPWLLLLIPAIAALVYVWLSWRGFSARCDMAQAELAAMRREILDRQGWEQ